MCVSVFRADVSSPPAEVSCQAKAATTTRRRVSPNPPHTHTQRATHTHNHYIHNNQRHSRYSSFFYSNCITSAKPPRASSLGVMDILFQRTQAHKLPSIHRLHIGRAMHKLHLLPDDDGRAPMPNTRSVALVTYVHQIDQNAKANPSV